jgi:hypothetical protein
VPFTPKLCGITQNPDTKDYIIVLESCHCNECGELYKDSRFDWCEPCQINYLKQNFANWTSENEEIDNFIQEMQLKVDLQNNMVVEWIPYNQFDNIKKTGNATIYSAIWKSGPLKYQNNKRKYERVQFNEEVTLRYLNNSQNNNISELLNEVRNLNYFLIFKSTFLL